MVKKCKSYALLILLLLIVGCGSIVPATTPPQLEHTPGYPLTVTDHTVDAGWFKLVYPDGWRIVTNVAVEPVALVLVSPDEAIIIELDTACDDLSVTPDASVYTRTQCFDVNYPCFTSLDPVAAFPTLEPCFLDLHITGTVNQDLQDDLDAKFDAIAASVEFR